MSLFKSKKSKSTDLIFITVSAEIEAKVSGRVKLQTQNVEFQEQEDGTLVGYIARQNVDDLSHRSKKGMTFVFDKNIASGTYSVTGPSFPFLDTYYFEDAAAIGFTTSYQYKPKSGTFTVEVIENNSDEVSHLIEFDFTGTDNRNKELHIAGKAELRVFKHSF
jgi:hypothetical protein